MSSKSFLTLLDSKSQHSKSKARKSQEEMLRTYEQLQGTPFKKYKDAMSSIKLSRAKSYFLSVKFRDDSSLTSQPILDSIESIKLMITTSEFVIGCIHLKPGKASSYSFKHVQMLIGDMHALFVQFDKVDKSYPAEAVYIATHFKVTIWECPLIPTPPVHSRSAVPGLEQYPLISANPDDNIPRQLFFRRYYWD